MDDRERQLGVEGAQRQRVALLAIAAGVLYFVGQVVVLLVNDKTPQVGLLQGLSPALHGAKQALVDPRIANERFLESHAFTEIFGWFLTSVGLICMIWPLRYLRSAEVARGGKPSKVTRFLVVVAPATCAVAGIGATIVETIDAHKFVTQANHTTAAFNALTIGAGPATFVILEDLGFLALVVTFILISLRAQRAGLLPKALGIIGIAAGVLFIIVLVPLPVLQLLWLVGIGMMLLELGGLHRPPAWDAGEAIPWVGRRSVRTVPPPRWRGRDRGALAPVPTPPPAPSRSASQKRKRRRG